MKHFAPAATAFLLPGVILFGVIVFALQKRRSPVSIRTAAAFAGLGLLSVLLGEIWSLAADRWLLGRINVEFYYAFVTAAIPEEGFRFLAIYYGLRRHPNVGAASAMLLGSLVGVAFATYEHILYALAGGWGTWLARSFTSVPYHVLAGAILGYAAVNWIRTRRRSSLLWLAALVVIHGLADWPLDDPSRPDPDGFLELFVVSGWAGNVASLVVTAAAAAVLAWKANQTDADSPKSMGPQPAG